VRVGDPIAVTHDLIAEGAGAVLALRQAALLEDGDGVVDEVDQALRARIEAEPGLRWAPLCWR